MSTRSSCLGDDALEFVDLSLCAAEGAELERVVSFGSQICGSGACWGFMWCASPCSSSPGVVGIQINLYHLLV